MSQPRSINGHGTTDPAHAAISELISAMSALNMEPSPKPASEGATYLSDTDEWAAHAYEHIAAAIDMLSGRDYKPRGKERP